MADRAEFLVMARRIPELVSKLGDNGTRPNWEQERPLAEHYFAGFYLAGVLAFLEGRYGKNSWNQPHDGHGDLGAFITTLKNPRHATNLGAITSASLDALICIRNAVTHNANDLSKNNDHDSLAKVRQAAIPGVVLGGTGGAVVTLAASDFTEFVRRACVAVCKYYGDA